MIKHHPWIFLTIILFISEQTLLADVLPSSTGLDLCVPIQGVSNIKITDETNHNLSTHTFDTAPILSEYTVQDAEQTDTIAYVHVKTNKRNNFTLTMTATPLIQAESSSRIDYTVFLDSSYHYDTKSSENNQNILTDGNQGNGTTDPFPGNGYAYGLLKVFSYPVSIDLEDLSYEAALEGTYGGTITFTYASN